MTVGSTLPDLTKYSNIAKLSKFAHLEEDKKRRVYNFYATGVGTPFEPVGDSGALTDKAQGMATAGYGQARLDWMFAQIKDATGNDKSHISQINVAIFGFSRGAALARAFVHRLISECAQIGNDLVWTKDGGEPPKLIIYYLGILDTVASVGIGGSRIESVARRTAPYILGPGFGSLIVNRLAIADEGGHYGWARDMSIPRFVRRCDHFIAAHEVREKFPSDSTRVDRHVPSNVREMLYPGMHSDVGGGYPRNYQEGRTNMLANIALCNLYFSAYSRGVPFKTPEQIQKDVGALFEINEDLQNAFDHYWKLVPNYDTLEEGIITHLPLYYHWRWGRTSRLKSGLLAPSGGVDKWMKITDQEWKDDVVSIAKSRTGYFRSAVKPFEEEIFKAWKGELRKELPQDKLKLFDLFFDKYVHDSIAGFKNQMSDAFMGWAEQSRWAKNRVYFLGRNPKKEYIYWQYATWSTQYSDAKVQVSQAPNQGESAGVMRTSA